MPIRQGYGGEKTEDVKTQSKYKTSPPPATGDVPYECSEKAVLCHTSAGLRSYKRHQKCDGSMQILQKSF